MTYEETIENLKRELPKHRAMFGLMRVVDTSADDDNECYKITVINSHGKMACIESSSRDDFGGNIYFLTNTFQTPSAYITLLQLVGYTFEELIDE